MFRNLSQLKIVKCCGACKEAVEASNEATATATAIVIVTGTVIMTVTKTLKTLNMHWTTSTLFFSLMETIGIH